LPRGRVGVVASGKQNTATLTKRGSGTPATTSTVWASATNAVDGTPPANPATYATWTNSTSSAVGTIEVSGYDFSSVPGTATAITVIATHRGLVNNTGRVTSISMQVMDGATTIGSATSVALNTSAASVSSPSISVTLAQLQSATFKVRITITHAANTQSLVYSLDQVDVAATYSP
jgi:hypothetical protein